jgi:hypothetical protein
MMENTKRGIIVYKSEVVRKVVRPSKSNAAELVEIE